MTRRARDTWVRESQRERHDTAGSDVERVRAIAADPHVYRVATLIDDANRSPHLQGGRPRHFPDWCLVVFGSCIRVFGSASATARALRDPVMWSDVLAGARTQLPACDLVGVPPAGPSRDHWIYFVRSRLKAETLDAALRLQRSLAIERAEDVGLLGESDKMPVGGYKRGNVVGIDGKVFTSPVRTLDRERVDRRTGEMRPVREDPGSRALRGGRRGQHRVGHEVRHRIGPLPDGESTRDPRH